MSSSDESPDEQADGGEIVIDGKTPLNSSAAASPLSHRSGQRGAAGVCALASPHKGKERRESSPGPAETSWLHTSPQWGCPFCTSAGVCRTGAGAYPLEEDLGLLHHLPSCQDCFWLFYLTQNARTIHLTTRHQPATVGLCPCRRNSQVKNNRFILRFRKRKTLPEFVCRSGLRSYLFLFGFLSAGIIAALFSLFFFSRLWRQWAGWRGGLKEMRTKRITLDVTEINTTRETWPLVHRILVSYWKKLFRGFCCSAKAQAARFCWYSLNCVSWWLRIHLFATYFF